MENSTSGMDDLIQNIDQVRSEMQTLVNNTDPTLEICPGWTIKDVVGHITAWEIVIHKSLTAFLAGDPPYFMPEQDFDLFNRFEVEKRSGFSFGDVIQEWETVRKDLKKTINKIKEEDLETELVLPWGSERNIQELIEIIAEHEEEHRDAVIKKKC